MWNLIKWELKANRKNLFFWSIGAFALTAICFLEYRAVAESGEAMDAIFALMPQIVKVMFGMGQLSIDEPAGYYACMFMWICLITFAHAAMLGGSLISKEERDRTAEFLNTKPISRSNILTGKLVVGVIHVAVVYLLCYITTLVCFVPLIEEVDMTRAVTVTMLGMFIGQLVMLSAGICISVMVRNYRKAVTYSAFSMIVMYLFGVILEMAEMDSLNFLTPFRAFNAVDVMKDGLSGLYVLIAAAAVTVMGVLAYHRYQRRNLQV